MTRYRLFQGKLREHPDGEWVRYSEADRLQRLEQAARHWLTHRCVHGVRRLEEALKAAEKESGA